MLELLELRDCTDGRTGALRCWFSTVFGCSTVGEGGLGFGSCCATCSTLGAFWLDSSMLGLYMRP